MIGKPDDAAAQSSAGPTFTPVGDTLTISFEEEEWRLDPSVLEGAVLVHTSVPGPESLIHRIRLETRNGNAAPLRGSDLGFAVAIDIWCASGTWVADVGMFGQPAQRADLAAWCQGTAVFELRNFTLPDFTMGGSIRVKPRAGTVKVDCSLGIWFEPRDGTVDVALPDQTVSCKGFALAPAEELSSEAQAHAPANARPGAMFAASPPDALRGNVKPLLIGSAGSQSLALLPEQRLLIVIESFTSGSTRDAFVTLEGDWSVLTVTGDEIPQGSYSLDLDGWSSSFLLRRRLETIRYRLTIAKYAQTIGAGGFALGITGETIRPIELAPRNYKLAKRLTLQLSLVELQLALPTPLRGYVDFRRRRNQALPDPGRLPREIARVTGIPIDLHLGDAPLSLVAQPGRAAARIGTGAAAKADLATGRLRLRRTIDGFDLSFGFVGYAVDARSRSVTIVPLVDTSRRLQIVHFWPQHIQEEVFSKANPQAQPLWQRLSKSLGLAPSGAEEEAPVRRDVRTLAPAPYAYGRESLLARTRAAGPSRLVIDRSGAPATPLAVTPEALTNWSGLPLAVDERASPEGLSLDAQIALAGITPSMDRDAARRAVVASFGYANGAPSGTIDPGNTALELVTGLVFSPERRATFTVPAKAPTAGATSAEQWTATLRAGTAVRAIWAPDLDLGFIAAADPPDPDKDSLPFLSGLTRADRREIVMSSSVFGLAARRALVVDPKGSGKYVDRHSSRVGLPDQEYAYLSRELELTPDAEDLPKMRQEGVVAPLPFQQFSARLSSFGADIDIEWKGEPPAPYSKLPSVPRFFSRAFSVERYAHRTRGGRDAEVTVEYKGYLFPLGVRASLIKIARREAVYVATLGWIFPLIQREFIATNGRLKLFNGPHHPFEARDLHARSLQMVTRATPFLDPGSSNANVMPGLKGAAFWARVNKADFNFVYEDPDAPGLRRAPMIFVDNVAINEPDTMRKLVEHYQGLAYDLDAPAGDQRARRTERIDGGEVRYAPSAEVGDTSFPTDAAILGVRGRQGGDAASGSDQSFDMDAFMEGADQPPFFPYLSRARVRIRALDRLTGAAPQAVELTFYEGYRDKGFDAAANPSELFLRVLSPGVALDLGGNGSATGGVARPEAMLAGLSRRTGLVGGRLRTERQAGASELVDAEARTDAGFDLSAAAGGQFDPSQFFRGATLLGIVPLELIVKAAGIAAAPRLRETLDIALPEGAKPANIAAALKEATQILLKALTAADDAIRANIPDIGGEAPRLRTFYPDLQAAILAFANQLEAASAQIAAAPAPGTVLNAATGLVRAWPPLRQALEKFAREPLPDRLVKALAALKDSSDRIFTDIGRGAIDAVVATLTDAARKTLFDALFDALATSGTLEVVFGASLWERLDDSIPPAPAHALKPWPVAAPRLAPDQARTLIAALRDDPAGFASQVGQGLVGERLGRPLVDLLVALADFAEAGPSLAWPTRRVAEALAAGFRSADATLGRLQHPLATRTATRCAAHIVARLSEDEGHPPTDPAQLSAWLTRKLDAALPGVRAELAVLAADLPAAIAALEEPRKGASWWEVERELASRLRESIPALERQRLEDLHRQARAMIDEINERRGALVSLGRLLAGPAGQQVLIGKLKEVASAALTEASKQLVALAHENSDKLAGRLHELINRTSRFVNQWGLVAHQAQTLGNAWCASAAHRPFLLAKSVADTLAPGIAAFGPLLADVAKRSAGLDQFGRGTDDAIDRFRNAAAAARSHARRLQGEVVRIEAIRQAFVDATIADGECAMVGAAMEPLTRLFSHWREAASALRDLVAALGEAGAVLPVSAAAQARQELAALRRACAEVAQILAGRATQTGQWRNLVSGFANTLAADQRDVVNEALDAYKNALTALGPLSTQPTQQELEQRVAQVQAVITSQLRDMVGQIFAYAALCGPTAAKVIQAADGVALALLTTIQVPARTAAEALRQLKDTLANGSGEIGQFSGMLGAGLVKQLDLAAAAAEADQQGIDQAIAAPDRIKALAALEARWQAAPPGMVVAARALGKIVDAVATGQLSRLIDFKAARSAIEAALRDLIPAQANVSYDWSTSLSAYPASDPIFAMDRDAGFVGPDLRLTAAARVNLLAPAERSFEAKGRLAPFKIHLLGTRFDLVTIHFSGATFTSAGGKSTFKADVSGVVIGPMLQFLKALEPFMGGGAENGPYVAPCFAPAGIEAGYRFSTPIITVGSLSFLNIALSASALLPFEARQAEFRFVFASRERPFLISSPPYGGGGFVALVANAKGIVRFEIQLEFGAVMALRFGPFRGHGRVTAGIYMVAGGGARILEGFVHAVGEGSVACFSLTINIEVLVRHNENGSMNGETTYRVTFRVGWAKFKYSVTARYKIRGGGAALAALADGIASTAVFGPDRIGICGPDRRQAREWRDYRNLFEEGW